MFEHLAFIPILIGALAWGGAAFFGASAAIAIGIGLGAWAISEMLFGGSAKQDDVRPDELDTATTTEARVVPVIWGTVRLPGNVLRMDKNTFISDEQVEDGGWFSDDVTTGYKYYVTYDYGICMGPVDQVTGVWANPGEESLWKGSISSSTAPTFTTQGIRSAIWNENEPSNLIIIGTVREMGLGQGELVSISGMTEQPNFNGNYAVVDLNPPGYTSSNQVYDAVKLVTADLLPVTTGPSVGLYYDQGGILTGAVEPSGSSKTFSLKGDEMEGTINFYFGYKDQKRKSGSEYDDKWSDYNNICYAHLPQWYMGYQARPQTLLFELLRLPSCKNEIGIEYPVADFRVRGSDDPQHEAYKDANPAAIVWELLTDKLWGRGIEASKLDFPAFSSASKYFAAQNIGISYSLGSQGSVEKVIDMVRNHAQLAVFARGEIMTCLALGDTSTAYNPLIRITRDEIIDIKLTRPAWAGTINELRATFINRKNNYQDEIVSAQDLASIQMAGSINSRQVNLKGFSNRKTAEKEVYKLLNESSYPAAELTGTLTRFHADLEPGSFVEFIIDDYVGGQPTTSYWQVVEINDEQQDPEGLSISLKEDYYATPYVGVPEDFVVPTPSYVNQEPLSEDDLNYGDDWSGNEDPGEISNFEIVELPYSLSLGYAQALVALDAQSDDLYRTDAVYRKAGEPIFTDFYKDIDPAAYGMTLDAALPAGPAILRNQSINFTVPNVWQRERIENISNLVQNDYNHIAFLTQTSAGCLFIGNEIMQFGYAIETVTGVEVKTLVRGVFGTKIESHSIGAQGYYFPTIPGVNRISLTEIPLETDLEFDIERYTISGYFGRASINPTANIKYKYARPMTMSEARTVKAGGEWTIDARPRSFTSEMHRLTIQTSFDLKTLNTNQGARIVVRDGASIISDETFGGTYFSGLSPAVGVADYNFIPQSNTDSKTGTLRIKVLGVTGSRVVDIYSRYTVTGYQSSEPLTIE